MSTHPADKFYTNPELAHRLYQEVALFLSQENINPDIFLEPCAGNGSFYSILPEPKLGYDLEPNYPGIIQADFLSLDLPEDKVFVTVGNPPFGKNSSLAKKFFNRCALYSAVIAFIVPKTFKKASLQAQLDPYFHLAKEIDIPDESFTLEGKPYAVPCVFQIWRHSLRPRLQAKFQYTHPDFVFTTKEKADFAVQRVGVRAGSIKKDLTTLGIPSHYFIKAGLEVEKIFRTINWEDVKHNTAGNPSISKHELILLYEKAKSA